MLRQEKDPAAAARFRSTLLKVISIQVVALLLLALLQMRYAR